MGNRQVHVEAKKHTTLPSPVLTLKRSHVLQRNPDENDRETIQAKSCGCSESSSILPPSGHSFGQVSAHNFSVSRIQPKLTIGQPNDPYEQEADRVADQVMRMPEPKIQRVCPECKEELQRQPRGDEEQKNEEETLQTKPIAETITPLIQRQMEPTEEEEKKKEEETLQTKLTAGLITPLIQQQAEPEEKKEEETLQTKPAFSETSTVSSTLQNQITALQGGGQPLPESERHFFEPRFGADFSQVRVHSSSQAAEAAHAINARAFTLGGNVVFGAGEYQPRSFEGQRLLAHELTHVVQQNSFFSPQSPQLAIQRRVTFDECEAREFEVKTAHEKAIQMCESTISQLRKYDGTQPANVKSALGKHFHSTTHKWYFQIAETVAYNLAYVVQEAKDSQYECHDQEDNGSTLAWSMWCVPFTDILLYKKWFAAGLRKQANTLVHEWMHRYGCRFDLGYDWEPEYVNSGTLRAIHNAEPYGNIVQDLG